VSSSEYGEHPVFLKLHPNIGGARSRWERRSLQPPLRAMDLRSDDLRSLD